MLTETERRNTARELQENFKRLDKDLNEVLSDLQIPEDELQRVLTMNHPDPGDVWMVRDYLEDKLKEKGVGIYPFSRLSDHSANRWYHYDTPWRRKDGDRHHDRTGKIGCGT